LNCFWTDLGETRVRVSKEPNGGEERKEGKEGKMIGSGLRPFYIKTSEPGQTRPGPLSLTLSRWFRIQMSLDQSNASGALGWSGPISIRGFGLWRYGPEAFLRFCVFLWFLLLIAPAFLLSEPMCIPNFLPKIRKFYYVFLIRFWLISDILTCSELMEIICVNFILDSYILCGFAWIFLCNFWSETCHVMLMLGV